MRKRIALLLKKPFLKNVLILCTGTFAAQLIAFIFAPIITRLYGPEAYGLMGMFISVCTIIVPVAGLAYPIAIVLPKEEAEAKALIKLSLVISIIISLTLLAILLVLNKIIVHFFQLQEIAPYLYLIPLVIVFGGIMQAYEQWLIRRRQFSATAKAMVFQTVVMYGGQAIFGFFYPFAAVLVAFSSMKEALRAFFMFVFSKRNHNAEIDRKDDKVSVLFVAKKYKDFPLYRAPEIFISAIGESIPIILLASLFGPASAGFYSISQTILNVPTQLLGKSVGDVFYPRIVEAANNNENITKLLKHASYSLAVIGIIPFLIVILFGPWIFGLIFGEEWARAGEYARWLATGIFFNFINQPAFRLMPVLSAQAFQLKYAVISLLIKLIMILISYYIFLSDLVTIAFYGAANLVLNLLLLLFVINKSKKFCIRQTRQTLIL